MKCVNCHEEYGPQFDDCFVDGVCEPCIATRWYEEEVRKENAEIERWNKKHGTDHTIDSFYSECEEGKITVEMTKGFKRLKEYVKHAEAIVMELKYYDSLRAQPEQLELFTEENDLPF